MMQSKSVSKLNTGNQNHSKYREIQMKEKTLYISLLLRNESSGKNCFALYVFSLEGHCSCS